MVSQIFLQFMSCPIGFDHQGCQPVVSKIICRPRSEALGFSVCARSRNGSSTRNPKKASPVWVYYWVRHTPVTGKTSLMIPKVGLKIATFSPLTPKSQFRSVGGNACDHEPMVLLG